MVYEDDDDDGSRRRMSKFGIFKKVVYSIIIVDVLAMLWYLTRK